MEDPLGRWLIAVVCFIFAALLSACESGVKHANEEKVSAAGARMMRYVRDTKYPLASMSGMQLLLLMVCAAVLAPLFASNTWSTVLLCLLVMFIAMPLAVLFPNRLAKRYPNGTVLHLKGLIIFVCWLTKPFALFAVWLSDTMLLLLGKDTQDKEEVTEEEIKAIVDIGEESGAIEQSEHEMITNVLEFTDMTAANCMTHRTDVVALWVDDDDETILNTIRETGRSRFPVYDEDIDHIIGVLTARDYLLNAASAQPREIKALLREPYFVPKTVKTDVLLKDMQRTKTHIAIVLDEFGGVSGLITMEDLLEEIVGNIYDESDPQEQAESTAISENVWQVTGGADLGELAEEMQVTLSEDEDYDTIGGLIFSKFTVIPDDGTTPEIDIWCARNGEKPEVNEDEEADVLCDLLHIRVDEILDRRVEKATITLLRDQVVPKAEPEEAEA